ncbi:MAG TPA: hypothetical protein VF883_16420 [Thermoanaerobaculia bacterium]|jgi:hypothetical protein
MKTLALILALLAADDTLVGVAKDAKEKRRKSTSKVITNADVKKSKGKVQTTNAPTTPVVREPSLMEKHQATRAAAAAAAAHKAKYETVIAQLEKELAAIEQSYYNENDLTRRDTQLVARFNDVKTKLDAARKALASPAQP